MSERCEGTSERKERMAGPVLYILSYFHSLSTQCGMVPLTSGLRDLAPDHFALHHRRSFGCYVLLEVSQGLPKHIGLLSIAIAIDAILDRVPKGISGVDFDWGNASRRYIGKCGDERQERYRHDKRFRHSQRRRRWMSAT